MTKQKENLVQFLKLPEHLKKEALAKAIRIGYTEKNAKFLWFNVQDNKLADGVIDKGFSYSPLK